MNESPPESSLLGRLWSRVKSAVGADAPSPDEVLKKVREQSPAPTFWLFGKTQSGKSSIIKYLTGADDAAIGEGFRPCTKTTRKFPFPTEEMPIISFLDTRGVSDPDYQPDDDLKLFDRDAHLMIVTAKITDLAQAEVIEPLKIIRKANPTRPIVLALTCYHEIDPTAQHPDPYPESFDLPNVRDLLAHHRKSFAGLFDSLIVIDLTKPEEGYANPHFGGPQLKAECIRLLPTAYAQSMRQFETASDALKDFHWRAAQPIIAGYSSAAAAAAAVPIPFLDMITLPAIQMQMCQHLGKLSGKPAGSERFAELAVSAGSGLLISTAARQAVKLIPFVGSAVAAAAAGASTYALGRAYCLYDQKVKAGHLPDEAAVKAMYERELSTAKSTWETTS